MLVSIRIIMKSDHKKTYICIGQIVGSVFDKYLSLSLLVCAAPFFAPFPYAAFYLEFRFICRRAQIMIFTNFWASRIEQETIVHAKFLKLSWAGRQEKKIRAALIVRDCVHECIT